MLLGVLAILNLILGLVGVNYYIEIYGLSTTDVKSGLGILLTFIFVFKGVVAFSLWFEERLAIRLALLDAIIGILMCTAIMFNLPIHVRDEPPFLFRPDLIVLIPYLWKMAKIKKRWEIATSK